ncbi:hypothetical protein P43SY_012036 [Pythium insidiosum]|uniref:MARVEL domain-containing protein n=1 Tax=Pythium insidiosum TaxID=114742 RepID=A0AAD5LQP9_PYTIN|nr:hypothetical protein P43SY_012036 [Pythium insidiosum]
MNNAPSAPPSSVTLAVRGAQLVCAALALGLSAGSFPGVTMTTFEPESRDSITITTYLGGPTSNFALLTAWSAAVFVAGWLVLARTGRLAVLSRPYQLTIDGVFSIVTLSAGIALAAGDYVHHCDVFQSNIKMVNCAIIKSAAAFQFLAGFAFLASLVMTWRSSPASAAVDATDSHPFAASVTPRAENLPAAAQPTATKDVIGANAA